MYRFVLGLLACVWLLAGCNASFTGSAQQRKEPVKTEKAAICDILKDPGLYDKKEIEVTGFVTRGFEDSIIFDPACDSRFDIWAEVGGKGGTGVMFCCGFTPKKVREQDLVVDGVTVPLTVDEPYANFEKAFETESYGAMVRATLIGRFFSGKKTKYANGKEEWSGFGHMGCCSLFVIQQVLSVDLREQPGLDRGASVEQPDSDKEGCDSYRILTDWVYTGMIEQQKKADNGERAWSFDNPKRVAAEELAKHVKPPGGKQLELTETNKTEARIIYHSKKDKKGVGYMIVVNRPYWLSFYAQHPAKTAWVVAAAYSICD